MRSDKGRGVRVYLLFLPIAIVYLCQVVGLLSFSAAFSINLAALTLVALVVAWLRGTLSAAKPILESRAQAVGLLLLIVVAISMRTYRWDVFPLPDAELWEEVQMGSMAINLLRYGLLDPWFPLPNLIAATGVASLGVSFFAFRIPFLLLGIASIVPFFVAARFLLKTYFAAFFAAGLFAGSAMLAGASRIALETMSPIFTLCVALATLFWANLKSEPSAYALAGVANGLLLIEYHSYRIVPFLSLAFVAWSMLRGDAEDRGPVLSPRARLRRFWSVLSFGGATVAAALPVALTSPQSPWFFLTEGYTRHKSWLDQHRAAMSWPEVMAEQAAKVWHSVELVFAGGSHTSDVLPSEMGVIEYFTGILGAVAMVHCLIGARRSRVKLFLVGTVLTIVVLGALVVGHPQRYRLLPIIPIYLLAIGIMVDDALTRFSAWRRRLQLSLVMVLGLLIGRNAHQFFTVAIFDSRVQHEFYDMNMVLTNEIVALQSRDPMGSVVLVSDRDYFARYNDFAIFYDHRRVRAVAPGEPITDQRGYLLSHDEFIPAARAVPGVGRCQEWETRFGNRLLSCRLGVGGD
jgi:hypothetical protein